MSYDTKHTATISETIEYFIVGNEPLNANAVAQARHDFRHQFAHEPKTLRVGHYAFRELQKIAEDFKPYEINTYYGMNVELDEALYKTDWRVGTGKETLREVEV